ncbi:hypothetical protein [methane-oxidizing endosymbiont of Gigantopelta aegis]|uniref:hypothetical protein n=1 Tax=methane-oxidizing endosymbiont of Gigantopelta aegis TaxID=2794938 RepID=UPI0018DC9305|nr:hypothetical protein [methane-oxidizing endosymbiont of Gigantopelta aegis]
MAQYSPQTRGIRLGWIEAWRKKHSESPSINKCCSKAGVSPSSYRRWRKWAEEDSEHISAPTNKTFSVILNGDMDGVPDMDNVPDLDNLPDA